MNYEARVTFNKIQETLKTVTIVNQCQRHPYARRNKNVTENSNINAQRKIEAKGSRAARRPSSTQQQNYYTSAVQARCFILNTGCSGGSPVIADVRPGNLPAQAFSEDLKGSPQAKTAKTKAEIMGV